MGYLFFRKDNNMDDFNKITITDEDGKSMEMNILFTFDANDANYVICYLDGKEDEIYPFRYDEEGNLEVVEDEEELAMIDEVVAAFDGEEDE